ncbi:Hypothetical_protein [Hexamita inflata]|uniref:Hypothetical_protein n=1 Tax=Hexamita inflata TaxID=28002 RepID=A0ABP1IT16_9EUKA
MQDSEYLSILLDNLPQFTDNLHEIENLQIFYSKMSTDLTQAQQILDNNMKIVTDTYNEINIASFRLQNGEVISQSIVEVLQPLIISDEDAQVLSDEQRISDSIKIVQKLVSDAHFEKVLDKFLENSSGTDRVTKSLLQIKQFEVLLNKYLMSLVNDSSDLSELTDHIELIYFSKFLEEKLKSDTHRNLIVHIQQQIELICDHFVNNIKNLISVPNTMYSLQALRPESDLITDVNVFMPVLSPIASKKYHFDQQCQTFEAPKGFQKIHQQINNKLVSINDAFISTFMFDREFNGRYQAPNNNSMQNQSFKIDLQELANQIMKHQVQVSINDLNRKVFNENLIEKTLMQASKIEDILVQNYHQITGQKLFYNFGHLYNQIQHQLVIQAEKLDMPGCVNIIVGQKRIQEKFTDTMKKIYKAVVKVARYKFVLYIKQYFVNFSTDEKLKAQFENFITPFAQPIQYSQGAKIQSITFNQFGDTSYQVCVGIRIGYILKGAKLLSAILGEIYSLLEANWQNILKNAVDAGVGHSDFMSKDIMERIISVVKIITEKPQ